MAYKLIDGDYVKNGEGFVETELEDELVQRAMLLLHTKRRSFYPDKNYGSRLAKLSAQQQNELALAYARQALDGLDGVYAIKARLSDGAAKITLLINNEERQVDIELNGIL